MSESCLDVVELLLWVVEPRSYVGSWAPVQFNPCIWPCL